VSPTVAIVAPGSMGAAVGARLVSRGARVLTTLEGRSGASRGRAHAAGLTVVAERELLEADFLLSIVPPAHALALAERLAPRLREAPRKPVFVDCNAVSPATMQRIADAIAATATPCVDAGIIGMPPRAGASGPNFYASGPHAERFKTLSSRGLEIRVLAGPIGAASALKMSYAGITKGITAVATSMLLAATRGEIAEALKAELAESQPSLLASFQRTVPGMFPKAYRWVAEMCEIATFAGDDLAAAEIFQGAAALYDRIARDVAGERREARMLESFLTDSRDR
jgi:3-hydroxyisobutyrate dehydrogenase-like beta-hydroxyacid dehydrogenase